MDLQKNSFAAKNPVLAYLIKNRSLSTRLLQSLLFFIFLFTCACGYHLRGVGQNLPKEIKTIGLSPFANDTFEGDLEILLSEALAEEFSKTKRLTVTDVASADVILGGNIRSYSSRPVSFSSSDVVQDYRVEVSVDVVLKRKESGELIWKGKNLKQIKDYRAEPGNVELSEENRSAAKRSVAAELAEMIYDRIFEDF